METDHELQIGPSPTVQPAERAAAAALLWHFEDDDVKTENIALRQAMQDVSAQLVGLQERHAALEMQHASETASLRVAQESLRYERRINMELEGMHRLATENLTKLRDEVRTVYQEHTLPAVRAIHARMEEALLSMGWKRAGNETLDQTLQRGLSESSCQLKELEQQNKDLKTYVTLLEFIWTQPLDCALSSPRDATMCSQAEPAGTSQVTEGGNLLESWSSSGAGPFDASLLSF